MLKFMGTVNIPLKYQSGSLGFFQVIPWMSSSTLDVFLSLRGHCVGRKAKLGWQIEKPPASKYSELLSSECSEGNESQSILKKLFHEKKITNMLLATKTSHDLSELTNLKQYRKFFGK